MAIVSQREYARHSEEYFKQITAEQLAARIVKGYRRPEWQKTRERNEALDCRVYARAAAAVYGMDRFSDADWQKLDQHVAQLAAQANQPSESARPQAQPRRIIRSGWLDSYRTENWFERW